MSKLNIYNQEGKVVKEVQLASTVFATEEKTALLAQAVKVQMANSRNPIAHTKTRGEVSGGGRKPHKQKGTGSARAGSTRSPLWIGGGVTFGPRNVRNFKLRLPQKMRQAAIRMVLTQKLQENKIIVVDEINLTKVSTKEAVKFLTQLPIEKGTILVLTTEMNANLELSTANLPYLKIMRLENINLLDIMKFDYLLTTSKGLEALQNLFAKGAK